MNVIKIERCPSCGFTSIEGIDSPVRDENVDDDMPTCSNCGAIFGEDDTPDPSLYAAIECLTRDEFDRLKAALEAIDIT